MKHASRLLGHVLGSQKQRFSQNKDATDAGGENPFLIQTPDWHYQCAPKL